MKWASRDLAVVPAPSQSVHVNLDDLLDLFSIQDDH